MATTTRVLTASVNGTVYTTNANGALEAIDTCHSGATAPTDELANGKLWLDTTTTPGILKMYNNSVWEEIGGSTSSPTFDTVNATTVLGDGSGLTGIIAGVVFARKTANYTAAHLEGVIADTSGGTFTVTLPATPSIGDYVVLTDGASWSTINLTVARNGSTIEGDLADMTMDIGGVQVTFIYDGTTWQIYTTAASDTSAFATAAQGALADSALQPAGDGSGLTGISPHKPVAVTGATPSLNVGTYNFFDNGTLTAGTTVSFASVPTEARWSYSFVPDLVAGTTWDVTEAVYVQNFSVATEDTTPQGLFFKPDGTKMYVLGNAGTDVNEYDLSTAWDVSTAVYLQLFSVSAQDTVPYSVFFKPDGTKMYVIGIVNDNVYEYDLSTAWNISTAVFLQAFSVATQDLNPRRVFFKPDGLKMYVTGDDGDNVYEYNLSTAWNVSTASFLQLFSVATQEAAPRGLFFKPDGLKMYLVGAAGLGNLYEYDLSTAWDVTTAVYLQLLSTSAQDTGPSDVFFKPDGRKMYVIGTTGDNVYEYDVGTPTTMTLPASVVGTPTALALGNRVTYEFQTDDAGTTVNLISEEVIET